MTTPKPGDRYRDADGRLLELLQRVDPHGDVPPYWRVRTVVEVSGLDTSTILPTTEERPGRESTVREDRLGTDYAKEA